MKFSLSHTAIACAAALLVAGCGGSDSSSDASGTNVSNNSGIINASKSLTLSGTAATGLALSGGSVTVGTPTHGISFSVGYGDQGSGSYTLSAGSLTDSFGSTSRNQALS